ncbi:MAG: glycosyltransferase family 2 protein [Pseudomonadales bacterium]|nr:glycosyltransferase family 2 protein [Pseudomonadales bacterium]
MKFAYVCTNFNNTSYTLAAIRSLYRCDPNKQLVYVVVDNASAPVEAESLSGLEREFVGLHLIRSERNLGYFSGLNLGLDYVRRFHSDVAWVIVGNNDLVFSDHFVETLANKSEVYSQYAVIAPNIVTLDGDRQNPHIREHIGLARIRAYDTYYSSYLLARLIAKIVGVGRRHFNRRDQSGYATAREIYACHGSCFVLSRKFFETFGELWAPTFMFGEEVFLAEQVAKSSMRILYSPELEVIHASHAAVSGLHARQKWELMRIAYSLYRPLLISRINDVRVP